MFNKKEYMKKYRAEHKEQIRESGRLYNKKHRKKIKKKRSQYYENHRERELKLAKIYQKLNYKKLKEYRKKYYQENREREIERVKQYRINNPEKIKESHKEYYAKKYKVDLKFTLNSNMANAIKKALKGNKAGRAWESLTGYTIDDLLNRLKSTMPKGYTWQDYLKGKLHIDHIIPKSVFNYFKPEHPDFKRCWALNNLRLLPARENIIKRNKIKRPFQPALQLC